MADDPIRRGEFDRYREGADRRLDRLEQRADAHDEDHDERRRWTWQQVVAVASAAILLATLWLQATAK